jgi:hypothetical protein
MRKKRVKRTGRLTKMLRRHQLLVRSCLRSNTMEGGSSQIDEDAAAASASASELPPKQHDGGGVIDEFSSRFRYEKTCSKFIMPNTEC